MTKINLSFLWYIVRHLRMSRENVCLEFCLCVSKSTDSGFVFFQRLWWCRGFVWSSPGLAMAVLRWRVTEVFTSSVCVARTTVTAVAQSFPASSLCWSRVLRRYGSCGGSGLFICGSVPHVLSFIGDVIIGTVIRY